MPYREDIEEYLVQNDKNIFTLNQNCSIIFMRP